MAAAKTTNSPKRLRIQFCLRTLLIVIALAAVALGLAARQVHEARRQRLVVEHLRVKGARVDVRAVPTSWAAWLDTNYLARVRYVTMDGNPVEDVGLFAEMTNLEELYLWKTGIADVSPLVGLKKLRVLDVSVCPVNDIRPLAALQSLETLGLAETKVRDLAPLRELKELRSVYLYKMVNLDLSPLASLEHLETVNLYNTPISDVTPLTKLKNLRALDITHTNVSDQSLQELKTALPACEIRHYREK